MIFIRRLLKKDTTPNREAKKTAKGEHFSIVKPLQFAAPKVWAIGGGKGGVGKSLITVNFGVLLSRLGHRVLLIDADIGAANLHTFIGVDGSKTSLSSFLKGEISDLRLIIRKTSIPNLDLISGARDSLDVADIKADSILRLKNTLRNLEFEYVLLDIGPGTSSNMLDLFLIADEGVLVSTPEPTSIENTYRFLKCLFLRRIKNIINSHEDSKLKDLLNSIFSGNWSQKIRTVSDIITQLKVTAPHHGEMLQNLMGNTHVSFIINQVKRPEDKTIGPLMETACHNYFSLKIRHLGDIANDDSVSESIRARRPLMFDDSQRKAAADIDACLNRLVSLQAAARARQTAF